MLISTVSIPQILILDIFFYFFYQYSPYHGAPPPVPRHTTISQHAMQQVYILKLEKTIRLFDQYVHVLSITMTWLQAKMLAAAYGQSCAVFDTIGSSYGPIGIVW